MESTFTRIMFFNGDQITFSGAAVFLREADKLLLFHGAGRAANGLFHHPGDGAGGDFYLAQFVRTRTGYHPFSWRRMTGATVARKRLLSVGYSGADVAAVLAPYQEVTHGVG